MTPFFDKWIFNFFFGSLGSKTLFKINPVAWLELECKSKTVVASPTWCRSLWIMSAIKSKHSFAFSPWASPLIPGSHHQNIRFY
jgi:hypothetical protein